MQSITFLGKSEPALGQGTWNIGDHPQWREREIDALRRGLDLGMSVIDTAEMYGDGASETLVGEALAGRRSDATVVTKVYPHNAGRLAMQSSCEASLKRLRLERIDLYLLHWRGFVPLAETVDAFERLQGAGKIAAWGVSNFDVADLEELHAAGGTACAANQILYNPLRRGPEYDLLPWMHRHGMPAMAYSPLEQGRLGGHKVLQSVARRYETSVMAVALAFVMRSGQVMAIPKAADVAHVEANRHGADLVLDARDMATLDAAFPTPKRKVPLAML